MSWGYKITFLYIGFVLLIVTLVCLSSRQKVDLVADDYYEQELHFQDKLDKSNRSNDLNQQLTWSVESGAILLNMPKQFREQKTSGTIYFFRPSDVAMDKTLNIPSDTNLVKRISTTQLKNGVYKMEINWEVNEQKYYNEGTIKIYN